MVLPDAGYFTDPARTNGQAKQAQDDILEEVRSTKTTANSALKPASNLSDVADAPTARGNLGAEPANAALLKSDTPATLTTGYAETPLAITSGATINVLAGSLRIASPPTGFTVGPMNSVGRVTILITGGTSFAYDASYDFVVGAFDSTKSGHAVQVINTGTTRWLIIVPSEV